MLRTLINAPFPGAGARKNLGVCRTHEQAHKAHVQTHTHRLPMRQAGSRQAGRQARKQKGGCAVTYDDTSSSSVLSVSSSSSNSLWFSCSF
jgi:hypothetical protein